ncbi:hypothetical protein N8J89_16585 [Crossiella sp. CA-258035]|uniref:hypothetical protein n=1 Tax=Crossiella sp. CA-258035 TaxID=2981138 RepID=UPI0024BD5C9C|nr:hypothetical protein [Crossiella sp. CA-258035]WHT22615.1 hypothetical protein N8J89_16585 [Crossiella sp. CA-258035]
MDGITAALIGVFALAAGNNMIKAYRIVSDSSWRPPHPPRGRGARRRFLVANTADTGTTVRALRSRGVRGTGARTARAGRG